MNGTPERPCLLLSKVIHACSLLLLELKTFSLRVQHVQSGHVKQPTPVSGLDQMLQEHIHVLSQSSPIQYTDYRPFKRATHSTNLESFEASRRGFKKRAGMCKTRDTFTLTARAKQVNDC